MGSNQQPNIGRKSFLSQVTSASLSYRIQIVWWLSESDCRSSRSHRNQKNIQIKNNMTDILSLKYVYASVIYSLIGIFILVISFVILEKVTPENIYKEIVQKGNIALAIIAASFIIAVAIIISSAIHG